MESILTHKTCWDCDVCLHRGSYARHLRSKKHLIKTGQFSPEPVCYLRIKKKSAGHD